VLGAQLVREARTVQRIREEDEATEVRFDGGHAGNATTEGLSASDHIVTTTRGFDEDWDRAVSTSARQVDSDRVDAATLEADHVRLHRCRVARCAVTEDYTHQMECVKFIS
jgi:hypothetical protein